MKFTLEQARNAFVDEMSFVKEERIMHQRKRYSSFLADIRRLICLEIIARRRTVDWTPSEQLSSSGFGEIAQVLEYDGFTVTVNTSGECDTCRAEWSINISGWGDGGPYE